MNATASPAHNNPVAHLWPARHNAATQVSQPMRAQRVLASLLTATLTSAALSGCLSNPAQKLLSLGKTSVEITETPRAVSAREYGFVRPAADISILDAQSATTKRVAGDPWQRIRQGPDLAIPHHRRVTQSLKRLTKNRDYLNQLAGRARPYLHLILAELERDGLPTQLALLPEVESHYNPSAVSPMRAAGLWQFMPYTGKTMGLKQDAWYDARHDVLASTQGALNYLRQLHQTFDGDWALALAAYNAGPARVRAARQANAQAGKPTDYWSLDLPQETEHYVPKLLAVIALVETPERFGQHLPALPAQAPLAVIHTRQPLHLGALATASGLSLATLKRFNPGLKQGRTRHGDSVNLLIPQHALGRVRQHLRTLENERATLAASATKRPARES